MKAYTELLEDNKKDSHKKELEESRGAREKLWEVHGMYDPRYVKYQKEDFMNNKLMERLNTEIDFRNEPGKKPKIEKPFDDGDHFDSTESFARYEQLPKSTKRHIRKRITNN